MSGLSTKDVKTGGTGGGTPKIMSPGEALVKIHRLELDMPPFMQDKNGYYLLMHVETEAVDEEGWEGFFIDKDNESLGRYAGQVGRIKASRWAYADGTTKSGVVIERDKEILKTLKNICDALGITDWFFSVDGKYDTIEEFITGFNEEAPIADKYLKLCVAGKEYHKQNGYTGWDLYLPKYQRNGVPMENPEAPVSKLIKFDESEHLTKVEPKPVDEFGDDNTLDSLPEGEEINLEDQPEFEL